jgi:acetylornithine/succinyldiaminopimelate/putrescine aminotransferase
MEDIFLLQKKYLVNTYPFRGLSFNQGEGCYLIDDQNNRYLDLGSGYGVNIFGYNNRFFYKKLTKQLAQLIHLHGSFANQQRSLAAKRLIKRTNFNMSQVLFVNSGSEAVEVALKMALFLSKKKKVLTFTGAYHGKTLGALAVTDGEKYKNGLPKQIFSFVKRVKFNNPADLKRKFTNEVGVVIFEPIQGEGGIIPAQSDFVHELFLRAKEKKALIIVDEIQTGVGRTGTFLASEKFYKNFLFEPDFITLGKGLAAGLPTGAILVHRKWDQQIPKLFHTSTFGGNPLVCQAILGVLELITEDMLKETAKKGELFINLLSKIKSKLIKEIRGEGLMIGIEVYQQRNETLKQLQNERVIALPAGENVVRFLPPYLISHSQIKLAIKKISQVFSQIEKNV